MKRLADHDLAVRPRVLYTDLDGTLFGPDASLFTGDDGRVTLAAAEAVAEVHRAGVALVPVSGRTLDQVRETARVLGASDFICELGGIASYGRGAEEVRHRGAFTGPGTPNQEMARSGASGLLLESFPGRLEPHAPWAFRPRECSMLFRGLVEVSEAAALLEGAGYTWLALQDNGAIGGRYPGLDVEQVHAYHLLPRGVDKVSAVAADLERRGLGPGEAAAVGDSASDARLASVVGAVVVVANGVAAVEREGADGPGVFATERGFGAGFAEAVRGLGIYDASE